MQVTSTTPIFQKQGFPFDQLDGLMKKVASEVPDGFLAASDGKSTRLLFFISGKPYIGAVSDEGGNRTTAVKAFFAHYHSIDTADVHLFKADKKILLCMLVRFAHKPAQTFSTDTVNLEDVVKKIEEQKKDVVLSLKHGQEYGFAIFIGGRAAFVFVPGDKSTDDPPLDRLLLYSYNLGEDHLEVELYTSTKVVPSPDAVDFPEEGMATHYTKDMAPHGEGGGEGGGAAAGEEAGEVSEIHIQLMDGSEVKKSCPLVTTVTIGREDDNDLPLDEAGVSRHHAVIRLDGDKIIVDDLKSTNGTLYKGIRLENKQLNHGDEITVRDFTIRVDWPTQGGEEEKPPKEETKDLASETIYMEKPREAVVKDIAAEQKRALVSIATLVLDEDNEFPLGSITTIGKDEDSDIKIEGMLVAKRHAVVIRGKDVYKLIKKGALSAVKVNGEKVVEHVLKHGDMIEVGDMTLAFKVTKA